MSSEPEKKRLRSDKRITGLSSELVATVRHVSLLVGGKDPKIVPNAKTVGEFPPLIIPSAFDPVELLKCPGEYWSNMLQSFTHKLPIQMHMEPFCVRCPEKEAPPIFNRTVKLLDTFPELDDLMKSTEPNYRGRIKFRLSGKGKFIHRNRYERRNIICCLDGEQYWLLLDTSVGAKKCSDGTLEGGIVDKYVESQQNKNWNGFRSHKWTSMLTLDEMMNIANNCPEGVTAHVIKVKAGDIFTFDGRWWHATSYTKPVLSLFFTPGKNMEVALIEHRKRMALPMQKGLKVATINMAKCSKLSSSWKSDSNGDSMMSNWMPGMDLKT